MFISENSPADCRFFNDKGGKGSPMEALAPSGAPPYSNLKVSNQIKENNFDHEQD